MSWSEQIDWVFETRAEDIIAMRRSGLSLRAIGQRIGLSHVRILKILRERGEAPPPISARPDDAAASALLADRIAEIHPGRSAS